MHELSPTFAQLQRRLDRHVKAFARKLEFDLDGRELTMTDCWVNIMPQHVVHGLHLHPLSTISGMYYVQDADRVARDSNLKTRGSIDSWPRRRARPRARPQRRPWVVMPAAAGNAPAVRELAAP